MHCGREDEPGPPRWIRPSLCIVAARPGQAEPGLQQPRLLPAMVNNSSPQHGQCLSGPSWRTLAAIFNGPVETANDCVGIVRSAQIDRLKGENLFGRCGKVELHQPADKGTVDSRRKRHGWLQTLPAMSEPMRADATLQELGPIRTGSPRQHLGFSPKSARALDHERRTPS